MSGQQDQKFFYMNLKKQVSKNGKTFYKGKYAFAIDIIGFEKKDGSGDITLWLSPQDMDRMKQQQDRQVQRSVAPPPRQAPRNQTSRTPENAYVDHTAPPADLWDRGSEEPPF